MRDVQPHSPRPTLLLIDDTVAERELYEATLAPEFNILTASRGRDGLTIAARERPDLVLLDVMMPGIDGWETCTCLKSHIDTADIPVLLLTGSEDRDLSQHAIAVGATALLKKPCSATTLRSAIHKALGSTPAGS